VIKQKKTERPSVNHLKEFWKIKETKKTTSSSFKLFPSTSTVASQPPNEME
jgi:hypothetical protein